MLIFNGPEPLFDMSIRGPKVKCEKTVPVTERELRMWRRNVAHLIMFGKKAVTAERDRSKRKSTVEDSATVRISRDRKAVLIALSRKKGVSVRALADMAVDVMLSGGWGRATETKV